MEQHHSGTKVRYITRAGCRARSARGASTSEQRSKTEEENGEEFFNLVSQEYRSLHRQQEHNSQPRLSLTTARDQRPRHTAMRLPGRRANSRRHRPAHAFRRRDAATAVEAKHVKRSELHLPSSASSTIGSEANCER